MFLFLCYSSYILIIFQFYCVAEDTNEYLGKKEDSKTAIFGSHKYNPVLQIFEQVNEIPQNPTKMYDNVTEMEPTVVTTTTSGIQINTQFRGIETKKPMSWVRSKLRTKNQITRP